MTLTVRQGAITIAGAAALLLTGGCREAATPEAEPAPTATEPPVISVPTATASSSIIRPEVVSEAAVDQPPEPVELTIRFPEGSQLPDDAAAALTPVLENEALAQGWPIVLSGHSDSAGNDRANLATSRRRAEAVAAWLVEHGVEPERIQVIALGEQNPIAPNALPDGSADEAGRARNRRVDLVIAPPQESAAADGKGPSAMERLARD